MIINKLDSIEFRLKELHDFTWLKKYGTAFWVVDETGSGCICIGMEKDGKKYFCKIAGVNTMEAEVSPKESVEMLKEAVHLYYDLKHPNLIKIVEEYDYNQFYLVVFEWADGECLFDHWNFEKYQNDMTLKSPKQRFRELPIQKKLKATEVLFSFLQNVNRKGYVAVDFYDGSIMYDFESDVTTICDIDFFRKAPVINDKGSEFFGTFSEEEICQRYYNNQFLPCSLRNWQLSEASYRVATKAVSLNKSERYESFADFLKEWRTANCLECL